MRYFIIHQQMDQDYNEEVTTKQHKPKKSSFEYYGFGYELYKALIYKKFYSPLPIQKKAIPIIMQGRDIIVSSKTGSGKTLAYLLPLINNLKCHSPIVGSRALILVPTRELALQITDVLKDLLRFTDIKYAMLVGGHAFEGQFENLASNPDILVATPGRLMQLIHEAGLRLGRITMVVFDEADNLFEKGFSAQLSQILKQCPVSQKMMFSATVPEELSEFARAGLRDYAFIQHEIALPDKMVLDFLVVRGEGKLPLLINLLKKRQADKVIVFASTRYQVDLLQSLLGKKFKDCIPIYGKMEMADRNQAMAEFRACKKGILIVTDLASRGLDIPEVGLVIHFDYPSNHKIFVHRSGRTARKGDAGHTIAFVNYTEVSYMIELCYIIGRKLVCGSVDSPKDTAFYGSVPGSFYDDEEEEVRKILKDDDEVRKLHETSEKAMEKFRKCRTPASSYSIKLSKELEIAPHPRFRMMDQDQLSFIDRIRRYNPQKSFLQLQKIAQDKDQISDPFLAAVSKIRKEQSYKTQAKVSQNQRQMAREGQLQEIVKFNKEEEHRLKEYREKRSKQKLPVNLPSNIEVDVVSSHQKKSQVRDFKRQDQYISSERVPGVASEFDSLQKINTNQLDDTLNDEGRLKSRPKRVWDSKAKTFKYKRDKEDKLSKDEKGKHAYQKWKKSTHLSLQKVGEVQDKDTLKAAQNYWIKRRKFASGWKETKEGRVNDQAERKGQAMRKKIKKRKITGSLNAKKGMKTGAKGRPRGGKMGGSHSKQQRSGGSRGSPSGKGGRGGKGGSGGGGKRR